MPWPDLLRPFRRARLPSSITAVGPSRQPSVISRPQGRPSWAASGFDFFRSPLSFVPQQQSYSLYHGLRETIPVLNAAIKKTAEFIGVPEIEAEADTKKEIEDWLQGLRTNRIQTGWKNWLSTWISNELEYGRAHTEIILTSDRQEVYALAELHPATIRLHPARDRYSMDIVQYQGVAQPITLNPLLMLNAVHDVQGDDPNGTSLLWGLPFVAEIIDKMVNALGATWDRFGVPTYHINWLPPEGFSDPTGSAATEIMGAMRGDFNQAMISRKEADVRDFFTSGTVTVSIIGAAGEQLDFETPLRALMEQVTAATGIPPFLLGFHWSTTERMSAVQAATLTEMIESLRAEITGEIKYLITLRQQLTGGDAEFDLCWPAPTLIDAMDASRAHLFEEQAKQTRIANQMKLWQEGFASVYDVVRSLREDLEKLDDAAIRERLPDLPLTPPPVMPALPGAPAGGQGPGASSNPVLMEALASLNGRRH